MYPSEEKDNYHLLFSPYNERREITQPKPIGEYRIGEDKEEKHYIAFTLCTKPHLFHRLMCRLFFGLRWIDYKTK